MKALKITTNNRIELIDIQDPRMEVIEDEINGCAEIVRPVGLYHLIRNIPKQDSICMVVNENGLNLELDLNCVGTSLYNFMSTNRIDPIVGNILIIGQEFIDGIYELIGLNDEQVFYLRKEFLKNFKFLKTE